MSNIENMYKLLHQIDWMSKIKEEYEEEIINNIELLISLLQKFRNQFRNKEITLIGSTGFKSKMEEYKEKLEKEGYKVNIPVFDDKKGYDELDVCEYNRKIITRADRIDIIWDRRSIGTIFDFGMCFAMRKPIKIVYLEPKTFEGVMRKYESEIKKNK